MNESDTLRRIHAAATTEFLLKGYQGASLRSIVKDAGVTTGAFYGYYGSKEDLFDALVSDTAHTLFDRYCGDQNDFVDLPVAEQQRRMGESGKAYMLEMLDFACAHRDAVRLILQCADGTKYEGFIHQMVEIEVNATADFIARLRQEGISVQAPNPVLTHMLTSGMFSAFFELIIHDVPQEERRACVTQLADFQTAGWRQLMGL